MPYCTISSITFSLSKIISITHIIYFSYTIIHLFFFIHPSYAMIDLGTLGGLHSQACAISPDGLTVVGFSNTPIGTKHAFKYKLGSMFDLGTLGGNESSAIASCEFGSVIIGNSTIPGDNHNHAFVYTDFHGLRDLGTLGGDESSAKAISHDGKIIIGSSMTEDGNVQAFIQKMTTLLAGDQIFFIPQGNLINLGTLGGLFSYATDLSYDGGVIVGSSSTILEEVHAFKHTSLLGMLDLGTLGGKFSIAESVSLDGNAIVGSSTTRQGTTHAFKYTPILGMYDLGTLGGTYSKAIKVSGLGNVVIGESSTSSENIHAFKYSDSTGMIDLGTLGGNHSQAIGLSYYGTIVVGNASTFQDKMHGFIHTDQTGILDIGTLGGEESFITGISLDGQIICGYSNTSSGTIHAFIHRTNIADIPPRPQSTTGLQQPLSPPNHIPSDPSSILTSNPSSPTSETIFFRNYTSSSSTPSSSISLTSYCSQFPSTFYNITGITPPSSDSASMVTTSPSFHSSNKSYPSMRNSDKNLKNNDCLSPQSSDNDISSPTCGPDPILQRLQEVATKLEILQQQQQDSPSNSDQIDGSSQHSSYVSSPQQPLSNSTDSTDISYSGSYQSSNIESPNISGSSTPPEEEEEEEQQQQIIQGLLTSQGAEILQLNQTNPQINSTQTTSSSQQVTPETEAYIHHLSNPRKLVDIDNTSLALELDAAQLSNILANNYEEISQALNSDCNTFGPYGFCLSIGNRYLSTKDSQVSQTIGMVNVAFKFTPYLRIGLALDKSLTKYNNQYKIKYSEPLTTLYCVYEQSTQSTGIKFKITGTQRISDVKIARMLLPYTEEGKGHTKMEGFGFEAQTSYGFMLSSNWTLQPIVGVQHINITRKKYQEFPQIQFPITYNQAGIQITNVETAALLEGKVTNWFTIDFTGSIKHIIHQNNKSYTGTIPYLGEFKLPFNTNKKYYAFRVGTTFLLDPKQTLRLQTEYNQSIFHKINNLCVTLQYSIGF